MRRENRRRDNVLKISSATRKHIQKTLGLDTKKLLAFSELADAVAGKLSMPPIVESQYGYRQLTKNYIIQYCEIVGIPWHINSEKPACIIKAQTTKRVTYAAQRDWSWKPTKKVKNFYTSRAWMRLRYDVLTRHGRKCMACGNENGVMHVDHIKPRSKYPELALAIENLQILCEQCNFGKGTWNETDWR